MPVMISRMVHEDLRNSSPGKMQLPGLWTKYSSLFCLCLLSSQGESTAKQQHVSAVPSSRASLPNVYCLPICGHIKIISIAGAPERYFQFWYFIKWDATTDDAIPLSSILPLAPSSTDALAENGKTIWCFGGRSSALPQQVTPLFYLLLILYLQKSSSWLVL